jgi:hypothetical protein
MTEPSLPDFFILKASRERYVLCLTKYNKQQRAWGTLLLNNPKDVVKDVLWMTDGTEIPCHTYLHERTSSRHPEPCYYESAMARTAHYMNIPGLGKVYEYTMTNPCKILPTKYYKVRNNKDLDMKWHFHLPLMNVHKIPSHVQEGFIELAISKGETCPITLEPFVQGNVTCTPCGHLFTKDVLGAMGMCPTCRGKI